MRIAHVLSLACLVLVLLLVAVLCTVLVVTSRKRRREVAASAGAGDGRDYVSSCSTADPEIQQIEDVLTPEECDEIVEYARGSMSPSRVYDGSSVTVHNTSKRHSEQSWISEHPDVPAVRKLRRFVEAHSGMSASHQELTQVVRYSPGGFFYKHYDACYNTKAYCRHAHSNGGGRLLTYLIYLNDGYEGGHTKFTEVDRTVQPKKGKMLVFRNMTHEGAVVLRSMHSGEPVRKGDKWIANIWVHVHARE